MSGRQIAERLGHLERAIGVQAPVAVDSVTARLGFIEGKLDLILDWINDAEELLELEEPADPETDPADPEGDEK